MGLSEFQLGMEACLEVSPEQGRWSAHVPLARTSVLCSNGRRRHRANHIEYWLGGIEGVKWSCDVRDWSELVRS